VRDDLASLPAPKASGFLMSAYDFRTFRTSEDEKTGRREDEMTGIRGPEVARDTPQLVFSSSRLP
jgi:hypothetical protein